KPSFGISVWVREISSWYMRFTHLRPKSQECNWVLIPKTVSSLNGVSRSERRVAFAEFVADVTQSACGFSRENLYINSPIPSLSSRSEEHTSELQSRENLVCRLLLEKKNKEESQKIES